jgi:hypothetical protein
MRCPPSSPLPPPRVHLWTFQSTTKDPIHETRQIKVTSHFMIMCVLNLNASSYLLHFNRK